MTDRPAALDDLLEFVSSGLTDADPLPPYNSIALDVLADALVEEAATSPAAAFVAAKYVLAQHARELAELLARQTPPGAVDPRFWAADRLREYAARFDGRPAR